MNTYFQTVGFILTATVLILVVRKKEKEMAMVITLCVIVVSGYMALQFLLPIIDLWNELAVLGEFSEEYTGVLLKVSGVCIISQISVSICADSGNTTLGKMIQILTNMMILYLGIPIFRSVLSIVQEILGKV